MSGTPDTSRSTRISWQYVALAAIGAGFLIGIYALIPNDQPEGRTALLGLVILAGQAVVSHFQSHRIDKVDTKVNGYTSTLISDLRDANTTIADLREQLALEVGEVDVSRETPPGEDRS